MTIKRIMWVGGALLCIALGFIMAQQFERNRSETRIGAIQEQHNQDLARIRTESAGQVDAMARNQGEIVLQAFAAGISPSVLADRRDAVEIAAVGMLHVPGVAGVHVLALDGGVIYSSDAKLTATGEGNYRGSWALQATELTTRPSARPDVIEIAAPIASAGQPQAVAWLEYDVAAAKNAASKNIAGEASQVETRTDATQVSSSDMPLATEHR